MGSMKKWMLGAAMVAGTLGMARSARPGSPHWNLRRRTAAYSACPGPGYVWVGGYWANGYWVPGYWNYVGVGGPVIRGGVVIGHGPYYGRHFAPNTSAGSFLSAACPMRPLQTGEAAFSAPFSVCKRLTECRRDSPGSYRKIKEMRKVVALSNAVNESFIGPQQNSENVV